MTGPAMSRELRNVIERELILSDGKPLSFPLLGYSNREVIHQESHEQESNLITIDELVTHHIKKALTQTNGKVSGPNGAAELLKINPSTLRNKMKKLGIRVLRGFE